MQSLGGLADLMVVLMRLGIHGLPTTECVAAQRNRIGYDKLWSQQLVEDCVDVSTC
jgi:hypothetical protein